MKILKRFFKNFNKVFDSRYQSILEQTVSISRENIMWITIEFRSNESGLFGIITISTPETLGDIVLKHEEFIDFLEQMDKAINRYKIKNGK